MPDAMTQPVPRTPLHNRNALSGEGIAIQEVPLSAKFILRVDPKEGAAAVESVTKLDLPQTAMSSAQDNAGNALLWIGPDEWMIIAPLNKEDTLCSELEDALSTTLSQVVNVTDYYTVIEVRDENARELLMKLSTIDLHERAFKAGKVVGTVFCHANVILWLDADKSAAQGPRFHVIVRRSMADYLWCLLAESGRQWGLPAETPRSGERLVI